MRILIIEDNESYFKLASHELKSVLNSPEIKLVQNEQAFLEELQNNPPDVIITDYVLPKFDGMKVLQHTLQENPLIPVIIFTGSMNEEVAVECMKAGAIDYVLKNNYKRLPFSVKEALEKRKVIEEKIKAEEKLKESETLFRTLAESTLIGIYLIKDLKFVYVNDQFTRIFGYSREELMNKMEPTDLVTNRFSKLIKTELEERSKNSDYHSNFIVEAKTKSGNQIFIEVYSRMIELAGEKYILGSVVDITDRILSEIEVQKSELLFRTIWENSLEAMRIVDENGIVIKVNQAYCELFEKTEEELFQKPFSIVYDESSKNEYIKSFSERIKKDEIPTKLEMTMILWNKKQKYLEARNKIITIEGKKYVLTIFRDISERKRYEEELIRAKEEALEMSRLKSNFLANMSHEIRTPLNGMIGFSELLMETLDGELKGWAKIIHNSSLRLLETLNTILDFTQIESAKIVPFFTTFDAKNIILEISKLFEQAANKKGLNLGVLCEDSEVIVKCDEKLLRRIVSNLVNNAIKFTLKGKVQIQLKSEADNFVISVSDTGIGIPEAKLDIIFEEFRQVSEGLGRKFEGTGLGLTIVKKYVEILNGKILVRSKVGEGSTFTVILPKQPALKS